jgi:hypothetical protein
MVSHRKRRLEYEPILQVGVSAGHGHGAVLGAAPQLRPRVPRLVVSRASEAPAGLPSALVAKHAFPMLHDKESAVTYPSGRYPSERLQSILVDQYYPVRLLPIENQVILSSMAKPAVRRALRNRGRAPNHVDATPEPPSPCSTRLVLIQGGASRVRISITFGSV